MLISASELSGMLASVTILDVRWDVARGADRSGYEEGHIPGAGFVELDADLAAPPGPGGRHPLPERGAFEATMRSLGVRDGRGVVVYDAASGMAAARAWWLLRFFGHDDVRVLDGGLTAWTAAGLALSTAAPDVTPGDFVARPGAMPLLDAAGAAVLPARGGVLIDARASERFRGEREPIDPVAGHIPGAVNRPTTLNVDPSSGRFLDPAALRDAFEQLGVRAGGAVAAYCGSGVTAAHEVLALSVAGFPDAALYVGSWSEWIRDPERPVAAGG